MISAWNNHSIPHKGIPNALQASRSATHVLNPADIPTASAAISSYRQQGGSLTDPSEFGNDPLASNAFLCQRRQEIWQVRCAGLTFEDLYGAVMCGNTGHLKTAILKFIEVTDELS